MNDFNKVFRYAKKLLDENEAAQLAFAAETVSGELVGFAYDEEPGSESPLDCEERFIAALTAPGSGAILRSAALWRSGVTDAPSAFIRKSVLRLAEENAHALHLLRAEIGSAIAYGDM